MTEPSAPQPAADDYDSPWKDVLEHAFPEFMAFYFPEAHAQIDWALGHEFKNTELRQVVRDVNCIGACRPTQAAALRLGDVHHAAA